MAHFNLNFLNLPQPYSTKCFPLSTSSSDFDYDTYIVSVVHSITVPNCGLGSMSTLRLFNWTVEPVEPVTGLDSDCITELILVVSKTFQFSLT